MVTNKNANLKKCGEILIDIKTKNRKNKIYIFHCTFCNIECDQLKKFSLHIGEEHLNNFEDILKETELKLEPEEIRIQTTDIEKSGDIIVERAKDSNPDPLDTVNSLNSEFNNDFLNEIKIENKELSNDGSAVCDKEDTMCSPPSGDSDKEDNDNSIFDNLEDEDKSSDTDTEEDINDLELIPLKKRKFNGTKKGKKIKPKMESESNVIKKHKRCKKRWKKIDDSKLPILIEMYKKYEVLWQVNDIAFGILPKRNETFGKMIEELKSNHNFDKTLDELQDYIDYINYLFCNDKEQELKCELEKKEFKPSSKFYKELNFLSESLGPFKCSNCNEIITKYDRYHIHLAQHNGTIPFQCRLCEMGFQKFDNYLRHVTRHLGINSYHCNVCGKGYPFKSELDWHLTSHTGVKPYLCPICGAGFRARHGYDNHIRRHEKRFRYECHICKHGFNHLCKLNTHIKSHLNIRDVICNVCGKGFTAAKYLQRHKLIHEEEKRYKCNVCGKAFAQDSGLRTHRKQHQPYAAIAENKNLLNKCL
ncbi:uncharacterized protein ACRADG_008854 isoform 1-T2 [Cochliomyia hominivorax]